MKIYINFNDLVGWILIGVGTLFFIVIFICAGISSKINDFKKRKEKKKRKKEADIE